MRSIVFGLTFLLIIFIKKDVNAQVYYLGNTGGIAGWYKLGTLHLGQQGKDAELRIVGGGGYNALPAQLSECNVHFRTSNGSSAVNGFYGAGKYTSTGRTKFVNAIKVIQVNENMWDFYASLIAFTGDASVLIFSSSEGTWTPGFSLATPPGTAVFSDLINELYQQDNAYFQENVGIGTTDTKGYKFAVAGNMIAESVKVKLQGAWPDYVFAKSYRLLPLTEIEAFINQNHHLPEMPSENEVAMNGINLGEIVKLQTKKIEELTLHLIELSKTVKNQQDEILKLKTIK